MERALHCVDHVWIKVNIVLYSGYAAFGVVSFFWPTPLKDLIYIVPHLITLIVYGTIVFGLAARWFPANYIVAFVSPLMITHLIAFTLSPLGMELAYIGPSRSFYSFYLRVFSYLLTDKHLVYSLIVFNLLSIVVHSVNFCYFLRRNTAKLFAPRM